MELLLSSILFFAQLVHPLLAAPTDVTRRLACADNFPSWTIKGFKATYSNNVTPPGAASFSITSGNSTEALTCELRANSRCAFYGTPANKGLTIEMQTILDTLYVTLNQTFACTEASL